MAEINKKFNSALMFGNLSTFHKETGPEPSEQYNLHAQQFSKLVH